MGGILFSALVAGALSLFLSPLWIKYQTRRRMGQKIRIDGPKTHMVKSGTPTMGGVVVIIASSTAFLLFGHYSKEALVALFAYTLCGLVGLGDDIISIRRERALGLRARTKLISQLVISVIFGYLAVEVLGLSTAISVPLTNLSLDLGFLYYPFIFLVLAATTNALNLTDGLDGLAAGSTALIMGIFMIIAFQQWRHMEVSYAQDIAILSAAVVGASTGFLWFNSAPANIFMGDTGSLSLGGIIAVTAILLKIELLLPIIGGLLVLEAASVIIQVVSYKLFKKRVFKMAPLHHHFELLDWPEFKVIIRFWMICVVFVAIGYVIFFMELI
ncbi:phospho-N-acetylmuramoyl-pentapeptide-transferase [Candidatus Hakubella thermalkaliphila]|uniref:Phospho-N-acetylmuramoyl-pentapeptide-transferase n=4 Tax=Candidatus Hakubella thermalkaliphila TaxID=2754717 RepID=A0A6V8NU41_9ACTN|nr:phospho-N-acetylmuramoyl-pentapeptide-transferase [Candidatus Hakubella thermalkaliphila]GFP22940.1 phospho-N-acetylmuramoyl-pentapeptide-transferase [Candidatus Hakubella thermalkaliphila]GFP30177.1 phospho-N-acetylmuramoyl-pentapeptide-transferase [Candidatus Hakubella thermalkaliphila]GFP36962.1 phospho-N-acetylmuramoyl-pentapeptide-transferase [Candidatus Hakubella thermalkaliphila]GFP39043.1 phospho-N-acetylmuramoyl-pentapeptide-transferase [Candidatus Hakubella thermalkaliphila]